MNLLPKLTTNLRKRANVSPLHPPDQHISHVSPYNTSNLPLHAHSLFLLYSLASIFTLGLKHSLPLLHPRCNFLLTYPSLKNLSLTSQVTTQASSHSPNTEVGTADSSE